MLAWEVSHLQSTAAHTDIAIGYDWKETKDGYERTLQVNVISTYWLGELLLPLLQKTASLPSPSSTILKPHMSIVGSFVHFLASFPEQNEEKPLAVLNDKSRFGAMVYFCCKSLTIPKCYS